MELKLTVEKRQALGKQKMRELRNHKLMPGVVYGKDIKSLPITLYYKEFFNVYKESQKHLSFIELDVDGKTYRTLIKEVQIDPVSRQFIHADFHIVTSEESIVVTVPFKFIGESIGVKQGGMIEIHLRRLEIRCLPGNLPDSIEIDISNMKIGHTIHIRDIKIKNVEILTDLDAPILSVMPPKKEVEEKEEEKEEEIEQEQEDTKSKTD